MDKALTYKIKPAGRHILTIGRDLIQDQYAAVIELVKNAYDADSPDVNIEFKAKPDQSGYSIIIADHGHGMSRDTVINKWMVPSTPDKKDRRKSPSGRIMQGRKGVGRYAASILGSDLLLETVDVNNDKTTVYIEWESFENAVYMDEVEILIDTVNTTESSGTKLTITGNSDFFNEWNQVQFDHLRFELKKLMPLVNPTTIEGQGGDEFKINLKVSGFDYMNEVDEVIEPYPIFDLFDYKISGKIGADGKGSLVYSTQKIRNATKDIISFNFGSTSTGCGELFFDIRVYDRESESIESLIGRGLKDKSGNYVGKLKARQLLNEYNGIGVYRNGFRIRPLGDSDFDWLKLNEQRVQNPSLRIGSNQVIGYVGIQSEEISGLIEKSARDGLRETANFISLKEITKRVIAELEARRFDYRRKAGLSRPIFKMEQRFEQLFSVDDIEKDITLKLVKSGIGKSTANEIIDVIKQNVDKRNKLIEEIRQAVAVYQGQATLGKIINFILHEGRRPLNYFKNQIPNLYHWNNLFVKTRDSASLEKLLNIVQGIGDNAEIFVKLFARLDPLAAGKRSERKPLELKKIITDSFSVFGQEIEKHHVIVRVDGPDDFRFSSWKQDIYAIFTNLIDNSLYWMAEKEVVRPEILIRINVNKDNLVYIDYQDSGPGIEPELIDSEVIFEPRFSTKPDGTGLGLAIAGEAASRNGLELKAYESDKGAWFRLQPRKEDS